MLGLSLSPYIIYYVYYKTLNIILQAIDMY